MYDDLDSVAGCHDKRHRVQLGGTWWLQFHSSKPDDIDQWDIHTDSDELSDWLLKHSNSERDAGYHAAWSERVRWTVDMYDNIDAIALLAERVRLQLGRAWWIQFDDPEPDGIGKWCLHGDSDEQCKWLYEHSDGDRDARHHASWCKCVRWTVDVCDDIDSVALLAEWVQL